MNRENKVDCVWDAKAQLGEGVVWLDQEQAVYWVDIERHQLHRYYPENGNKYSSLLAPAISAVLPTAIKSDPPVLVAMFADGVKLIQGKQCWPLLDPEPDLPSNRLNDACCDPFGNLWFGSMEKDIAMVSGAFYHLTPTLECHRLPGVYAVTNGPVFSPDGQLVYLTDSANRTIYRASNNAVGEISNMQPWVTFSPDDGTPDGMAMDSEQHIWVTHWGGFRVTRYTPEGLVDRVIEMPVPNVTKCAFGGPALKTLYITTASADMSEAQLAQYPLAGGLFAVELDIAGVLPDPFGIQQHPAVQGEV